MLGATPDAPLAAEEFHLDIVCSAPGKAAPLHNHLTQEVFVPLTGAWEVFWGPTGERSLRLGPWDTISIPPGVSRGFRNVGSAEAYLIGIAGGAIPATSTGRHRCARPHARPGWNCRRRSAVPNADHQLAAAFAQSMTTRASDLIARLGLQPHPEGGYYAEAHRSKITVRPDDGRPARAALTSIYYLLVDRGTSRWHRVASDEVWLHLEGAPLDLHLLDETTRSLRSVRLATLSADVRPQYTVPAGTWQAAQSHGDYTLVACVVAPGFEFADFEMMSADSPTAGWLREAHPTLPRWL